MAENKKTASKKNSAAPKAPAAAAATTQQPRIGLDVIYTPAENNRELKQQPHTAKVTNVAEGNAVNLQVFPDGIIPLQYYSAVPHKSNATAGGHYWDFEDFKGDK